PRNSLQSRSRFSSPLHRAQASTRFFGPFPPLLSRWSTCPVRLVRSMCSPQKAQLDPKCSQSSSFWARVSRLSTISEIVRRMMFLACETLGTALLGGEDDLTLRRTRVPEPGSPGSTPVGQAPVTSAVRSARAEPLEPSAHGG